MALAAFPSTISQIVEQDGYGETPQADVAPYKPSTGAPILRARSIVPQDLIPCLMWLSSPDYDTLLAFHATTLLDGTQPFTWVHPRNGTAATFQLEGDPPKLGAVQGPMYQVTFTLRLLSGGTYAPVDLEVDQGVNLGYDSTPGDDIAVQ
jgi:hypothetical protein